MTTYNWQQPDWPNFRYQLAGVQDLLFSIAEKTGLINGKLSHLSETLKTEAQINLITEEAMKTSEIEGEYLQRADVRSSIINKLRLQPEVLRVADKRATGVVDLMFAVRETFSKKLTATQLFDWHLMLLSGSFNPHLSIGRWREHQEPMQIISDAYGREIVHFEAPPSSNIPAEMKRFIQWFNNTAPKTHELGPQFAPVRAALVHLYFESIHPFEDGNGRIGRALAEKALGQGLGYPVLLSLSQAIESEKNAYYEALNAASKSNEVTPWIHYFVELVLKAQLEVESLLSFILAKAQFFDRYQSLLNERQTKVIQRMLAEGSKGFEGGMSAKKYMRLTDTSKATATRDLQGLVELKAFVTTGDGRNVRYDLNLDPA